MCRPIVQGGGIEIRTIRPHDRMDLRIDANLREERGIAQRTEQGASKHSREIDAPLKPIVEPQLQRERSHDLRGLDSIDRMTHYSLRQGFDWSRRLTLLQTVPVVEELGLMKFGPGLNQLSLPRGQCPGDQLDRINAHNGHLILPIRVKMGKVVLATHFGEHPDDEP
jgi:hypothetical protein